MTTLPGEGVPPADGIPSCLKKPSAPHTKTKVDKVDKVDSGASTCGDGSDVDPSKVDSKADRKGGQDDPVAYWTARLAELGNSAVDPATALDAVSDWFRMFLYTTDIERDAPLLALWVAHTFVVNETYTTPRLQFSSPDFGSGKSTALEHIERLSFQGKRLTGNISSAFLPRYLADGPRTVILDEVEKTLKPTKPAYGDIMSVLNDGYRFGASVPVLEPAPGGKGWVPVDMPIFAPVAWAGNSPEIPADTMSRTIRITMLPDVEGEAVETKWRRLDDLVRRLRDQLELAVTTARDGGLIGDDPSLPDGCRGRLGEVWSPLKSIAELASPEWVARVDAMIASAMESQRQDRAAGLEKKSIPRLLMTDIKAVFETSAGDDGFVGSVDLVAALIALHPATWDVRGDYPALSVHRMGRTLRDAYGIVSRKRGSGHGKRPLGYYADQFAASWRSLGDENVDDEG